MTDSSLTQRIDAIRQRVEELSQRLDKPRKNDKPALKESLRELTTTLGSLAESCAQAPAVASAPSAAPAPAPSANDSAAAAAAEPIRPGEQQRKDEFLSVLGHELRNSLAPILNSLHVLQLRGGADEGQRRFLEVIDRQTRHMAHLVDNLLDVSRLARGKIELQKEPVVLANLIHSAVESSRSFIESRNQKLLTGFPPRSIVVRADPARLEQVLVNLIQNAAKYTDLNGQIWVTAEYQNGDAVIRVRDTGVGLTPEAIAHLFEPFGPADKNSARTRGGLGLGLALVRGLVQMHDGSIDVFSEGPGRGSEFVIRLPATQEAVIGGESVQPPEPLADQEHPLRVLVIEDNKDTASTLGVILKLWGHEVEIAYNGHAGLNAARQFRPDVVLLDIELPGIDGYEVAKTLRHYPELDQTTIVAITGFGQPEDQARSREAGINYHYTKPIDLPSLRKLLSTTDRTEKRAAV